MPVNINQHRGTIGMFYFRLRGHTKPNITIHDTCSSNFNFISNGNILVILLLLIMNLLLCYKGRLKHECFRFFLYILITFPYLYHNWLFIHLVNISNDIESNPGPNNYQAHNLSNCHWNVNSILAHNYEKINA